MNMQNTMADFRNGVAARGLAAPEVKHWHLLDVYPGREQKVMRWFRYYGIDGWYPIEISYVKRGTGTAARKPHLGRRVVRPLVPGLIFVPDYERVPLLPGVEGLHHVGDCLARMSVDDMARLRRIEAYLNTPRSERGHRGKLSVGQLVEIVDGPFADFVGRIERLDSRGRLTVLIDAFKRRVSIKMDEMQIEPIASTPRG